MNPADRAFIELSDSKLIEGKTVAVVRFQSLDIDTSVSSDMMTMGSISYPFATSRPRTELHFDCELLRDEGLIDNCMRDKTYLIVEIINDRSDLSN